MKQCDFRRNGLGDRQVVSGTPVERSSIGRTMVATARKQRHAIGYVTLLLDYEFVRGQAAHRTRAKLEKSARRLASGTSATRASTWAASSSGRTLSTAWNAIAQPPKQRRSFVAADS